MRCHEHKCKYENGDVGACVCACILANCLGYAQRLESIEKAVKADKAPQLKLSENTIQFHLLSICSSYALSSSPELQLLCCPQYQSFINIYIYMYMYACMCVSLCLNVHWHWILLSLLCLVLQAFVILIAYTYNVCKTAFVCCTNQLIWMQDTPLKGQQKLYGREECKLHDSRARSYWITTQIAAPWIRITIKRFGFTNRPPFPLFLSLSPSLSLCLCPVLISQHKEIMKYRCIVLNCLSDCK